MKTGSLVVMCSLVVEVVVVVGDGDGVVDCVVDIDTVTAPSEALDAVVGCIDEYSVGNVVVVAESAAVVRVVVDAYHDGFRRKYNFDKRLGDCDEKLFSSFRYTE